MIVIKVNEVPTSKETLKERVRRAWRINSGRLYNQDKLIALYKGEILEEYKVLGYGPDDEHEGRVAFDLEENQRSHWKGKKIEYKTSNPCTIVNPRDLGLWEEELLEVHSRWSYPREDGLYESLVGKDLLFHDTHHGSARLLKGATLEDIERLDDSYTSIIELS